MKIPIEIEVEVDLISGYDYMTMDDGGVLGLFDHKPDGEDRSQLCWIGDSCKIENWKSLIIDLTPYKPKPKMRVKPAWEIVKWLEENGYRVNSIGTWVNGTVQVFTPEMYQHCGKYPHDKYEWRPEWLEEE